jgi:hypothetical protein
MKRLVIIFSCILLATFSCFAQTSQPDGAIGHGAFPVKITKTLDSNKLKEGDAVEVETAGSFKLPDGTLVPKGSKLLGHVVTSKARSKGDSDSQLTLTFEKLNVSGTKQLSLKGGVQAVFPPAEEPMGPNMATAGTSQGGSMGGSAVGGGGVSSGGVGITDAKSGSDTRSASNAQPAMNTNATGVQGMHDLSLDNGVLVSKGKNVKLGSGVRIVVNAEFFGYSPAS